MAWYRMYFVDRQQKIRWPYDLHANDDAHALALAHASQDACSDVEIDVELWQGARRIAGTSSRRPETIRTPWEELPIDRQESLLQIEEALRRWAGGDPQDRAQSQTDRAHGAHLGTGRAIGRAGFGWVGQ